jgi:hypothetical protein
MPRPSLFRPFSGINNDPPRGGKPMYAIFDKHGKKILAIVGSLLILVFLLPTTFGTHSGGGGGHLGKIDGKSIDANDVQRSVNALRSIDRLVFPTQTGQFAPVSQAIFPQNVQRQFEQNPVLFYLLSQEALQAGAAVPDTEVEQFLRTPVKFVVGNTPEDLDRVTQQVKDGLREDLRRVLAVRANFYRTISSGIKISKPLIDDALARQAQQIRVHLATFNASDFESKVAAPTEDELRRQFDSYKDLAPVANANNPFGFGYRVPDRIAAQWLSISEADVAKAVEATKSAELWDEDAIIYYQRNTSEFAKPAVAPATQPTTPPFEAVRADVLKKLRAPLIEQQKRAIANRIVQQLSTLHTNAKKQPTTGPSGSLSDPAYTCDALNKVADAIQTQTNVRPTVVAPAGLQSRDELEKQPGFGKSYTSDRAFGFGTGPGTLFDSLRALSKSDSAATLLDLGQPSPVFNGDDGSLYVARVVGVEPAHAAKSIDDVKQQVEKDVRRSKAFDLAVAAAQGTLEKANAGGLEKAGTAVQTSEFFSAETPSPAGLTGATAAGWVGPAFEALRGLKSKDALPVRTLAKQQNAGEVAVLEVFDVKTQLNTQLEQTARQQAEQEVARETVPPGLAEQWFNFDNVAKRVNYVPDEPRHEAPKPNAPASPANPFIPG